MEVKFKAINNTERYIGKIIKSSKSEYKWEFELNNKLCNLILNVSKFSGNYSVFLNDKFIYKGLKKFASDFLFNLKIEGINLSIMTYNYDYKLLIENEKFEDYYEERIKGKTFFFKNIKKNNQQKSRSANQGDFKHKINSSFEKKISNQNEEINDAKTIKENLKKNFEENNKIIQKKEDSQKVTKFPRTRFTKDFEEFEDMEIFIYPNDFGQKTQKNEKIIKQVNNNQF